MICCFMNLHEQESSRDLVKHFDTEIEKAILFGCKKFLSGTNHPEDVIFKERVKKASEFYANSEVEFVGISASDKELKELFIAVADWEIYAYET